MTDSVLLFLALISHPFPFVEKQVGLVEGMVEGMADTVGQEVFRITIGAGVAPPQLLVQEWEWEKQLVLV